MTTANRCEICGEPMPPTEQMFKFHGLSGPCPKPPQPRAPAASVGDAPSDAARKLQDAPIPDDFIPKLKDEVMRAAMKTTFTFTRDEVIELLTRPATASEVAARNLVDAYTAPPAAPVVSDVASLRERLLFTAKDARFHGYEGNAALMEEAAAALSVPATDDKGEG